jgi:crotonobetainyl-CoA:carnitine CoA-transferase CaiB-like acyl-CoA transferase
MELACLEGVLPGCHVLDLTDAKGAFCAELLSVMGAAVTRIVMPDDVSTELVKTADVLLESFDPAFLDARGWGYHELSKINPRLVMASITPFGQTAPQDNYPAVDITLQALCGWMSVTGEPDTPLPLPGCQAYKTAALFAANAVMLALWQRHRTGLGQHIDISIYECVAATLDDVLVNYFYGGVVSGRRGSRHRRNAFEIFRCRDGYVLLSLHLQWETLVAWLEAEGMAEDLVTERWRDRAERNDHIDHIIEVLGKWTRQHKAKELVARGQLLRFPWADISGSQFPKIGARP